MYFSEVQRFRQIWIWLILVLALIYPLTALWHYLFPGTNALPILNWRFIVLDMLIPILIFVLFLALKLKTRIDNTGIYYQFSPIHFKENKIAWSNVAHVYVRTYSPLGEFGGWGLRYSFGNGKAYNVSGNQGIQIVLKNNKKILLGTQKPDEANIVLAQLVKEGVISKYTDESIAPGDRF